MAALNSLDDFGKEIALIGVLIGILKESGQEYTINTDWFENPVTELETIDTRLDALVTLISTVLGPGVAIPLEKFDDAQWYPVPNPENGGSTAFHIVTPKDSDKNGQLGFGIHHPFHVGNLTIQAYGYVPLFSFSPGGATFIAGSTDIPSQIGLYITTSDLEGFRVDDTTFSGMTIDAGIFLAEKVPTIRLVFKDLKGTTEPDTYTNLESMLNETVISWIAEVIIQGSYWLHLYIGDSSNTIGDILTAAHFLNTDEEGEYHLTLELLKDLAKKDPKQIALDFLFAGLDALSTLKIPLIPLPGGGVYIERRDNEKENTADYGIRFTTEFNLWGKDGNDKKPDTKSNEDKDNGSLSVDISLGSWLSGETDDTSWMKKITGEETDCGLIIYLLQRNTKTEEVIFKPGVNLSSIGFNLEGGGDSPLLNIKGYTLKGGQLRAYLDMESQPKDWPFGFAIRLDEIGFPLGPSFKDCETSKGSTNVVVQSLLSSGDSQGDTKEKDAINPGFSAVAGYIRGNFPLLEIYDLKGKQTDMIWFPIQKRFGPVSCEKIGLKVDVTGKYKSDPVLGFVFDGGLELDVLSIYLDQLALLIHLKKITEIEGYGLDLQGMDVTFGSGGVEISGGLLKKKIDSGFCYDGELLIKAENFGLNALGSFGYVPKAGVSLFAFGMVEAPIGGPPYLCLSGLAAGFGLNRDLKIPAQDKVQQFPLVAGLVSAPAIGGDNPSPADVLKTLEDWVRPERNDYWLAAGVQVTSCEIITANVLLVVEFGKDFMISGIGIASLVQPNVGETFVYIELDLEFVFRPFQGELQVSAALAPGTFIIAPDVHLTGGFCFAGWFGNNEHSGDFVFTVGGYHPAFKKPDHYPAESPIGLSWKISEYISIEGGLYFAITPTAMMAGGSMALSFHAGSLKAWLKAQIDAILEWNPLNLAADASVSVGISYKADKFFVHKTFSVEISADFHIWWPPVGGRAHVNWYIISFSIGFGEEHKPKDAITWEEFTQQLPTKTKEVDEKPANAMELMAIPEALTADDTTETKTETKPIYLFINVKDGLKSTFTEEKSKRWIVRPGKFCFNVSSAIPASKVIVESEYKKDDHIIDGSKVAIRKVNGGISKDDYQSTQTITVTEHLESGKDRIITVTDWDIETGSQEMPQAMWGDPVPEGEYPDINPKKPTVTATTGVTMHPNAPDHQNCTPDIEIDKVFEDRTVNPKDAYRLSVFQGQPPYDNEPKTAATFADIAHINDEAVKEKRAGIFTALQGLNINGWTDNPLTEMAQAPGQDFSDEPMEGSPVADTTSL